MPIILSPAQTEIMQILRDAGEPGLTHDGISARRKNHASPTSSLESMQRAGYVETWTDGGGRRWRPSELGLRTLQATLAKPNRKPAASTHIPDPDAARWFKERCRDQ